MKSTDYIGRIVKIAVDRPMGSRHPEHGYLYPLNYGHVLNTGAPDGEGLDAYVLGVSEPLAEFEGRCIAVIHRVNDDDDDKLVLVPEGREFSDSRIRALTDFQERYFRCEIIRSGAG
jgi:inorganic pyrophosphatase